MQKLKNPSFLTSFDLILGHMAPVMVQISQQPMSIMNLNHSMLYQAIEPEQLH